MTIPAHVCCQCTCPKLRDGTQVIGPDHHRQRDHAGRGETDAEYGARYLAFRATVPMGTSTRCWVHNDPDNPERGGHEPRRPVRR